MISLNVSLTKGGDVRTALLWTRPWSFSSDKDKRNPLRYENFLQIASSPPKFHVLHPNNRKDLLVLDNHFRSWIQQFNSKQIRAMKEHLWSINICIDDADWQMNQDGSKSPPGKTRPTQTTRFQSLGFSAESRPSGRDSEAFGSGVQKHEFRGSWDQSIF